MTQRQSQFSEMSRTFAHPKKSPRANTEPQFSYLRDHRKRLRSRFTLGGADAMPDYELLERYRQVDGLSSRS